MKTDETEQVQLGETYSVGPLDIFLLMSFFGLIMYYYRNKNKEKKPEITGLAGLTRTSIPVTTQMDSSGFLAKMKKGGKNVAIFYGSQTGTAEEFSQRLAKDCQRYGLKAGVFDPEECELDEIIELKGEIDDHLAIFVMATYGEGDPTDNALPLSEWLNNDPDLSGLKYAVFALGNKTYEHYQAFGRFVDKKVEDMGGIRVHEIGEGDDDGNIEDDFVAWRETFWNSVCQHYGLKKDKRALSCSVSRDYTLKRPENLSEDQIFCGEIAKLGSISKQRPPYDAKNPYMAEIVVNRELHKGGDRSCMHIEIDIKNSGIKYQTGDHVGIYPRNDPELVENLAKLLNVDLDEVISLDNVDPDASKKHPFPCPCTYRTALLHYVDITSTVKHHVLAEMIQHAKQEEDIEKLQKLSGSNGESKEFYDQWIVNDNRHIVAVLEDLASCKPPLDLILELMPRLQCRYYSISSSSKVHRDRIHVTAVLVDWISKVGRLHKGVATHWLKTKLPGENFAELKAPIFVRHTNFRLPVRPISPVLMVGPGTGLAPFRGFIQERHQEKESGKEMGDTILYFGCRKKSEDFIYEDELLDYESKGTLTSLNLAFSRDQVEKEYVTHKLKENLEQVWDVIKKGGHLYVCGDARFMAKDVHELFVEAIEKYGEKSREKATRFLSSLSEKGRYCVDVWS